MFTFTPLFTLSFVCACVLVFPSPQIKVGRGRPALHPKFLRRLEAVPAPTQVSRVTRVPIPAQQERQPALPVGPTRSRGGEAKVELI